MKKLLTTITTFFVIVLFSATASASSITSAQTGNWNSSSTWNGGIPGPSDDVTIQAGHTVTLDVSPTVNSCTVANTGILDASTFTLTVSGAFTLQSGATFKQGGGITTVPGTTQSFASSSTYIFNGNQTSLPAGPTYGNLTWSSTYSPSVAPTGNLTINGNLTLLNCYELCGAFTTSGGNHTILGNVIINGAHAILLGKDGYGAGTVTWNITGSVTTTSGGTLKAFNNSTSDSVTFNIGGNCANNGNFDLLSGDNIGTVTLTFNGSSPQSVSGNEIDAQEIIINNSAGVTFSTVVSTYLTISLVNGTLHNGSNLALSGGGSTTIARTGGTLESVPSFPSGINVVYTGNVTTGNELPTDALSLGDLTINTSGTVTLGADATVNGTLTFTQGILATGSDTLTLASGSNNMVGEGAGKYVVGHLTVTRNVASGSSTLGGIGVTLAGSDNLGNVTVTRNSGSGAAVTANGKTGINRKWTISSDNPPTSGCTITFSWVSDDDNSKDMTTARVWKSTNSGSTWSPFGNVTDVHSSDPRSINSNSTTSFGQWTVSDGSAPLPVELTSFTATSLNNEIELAWATATEINNFGFDIERESVNSEQSTVNNWTKVGFVAGHGTTNAPQNYSFTDASVRFGKYSYRLKQIDHDGNFVYNQAIEATVGIAAGTVWLDNNYPNPFNPSTKISFVLGTKGRASLKVYNLLGQEVATLADGEFNDGETQIFTFDASKLSSGIYYYQLKSGNKTEIKKMMLLK